PTGHLIAGGFFTSAGGVSGTHHVAEWDGAAWSALGTGFDDTVLALAVASSGDLYAAGNFLFAGNTSVRSVARWDGAQWVPLGAGLTLPNGGGVFALAALPTGDIIVGGQFTTADGQGIQNIARWDGSSWSALGLGINGTVLSLGLIPNGD